jgi:hypothetical protein
VGDSVKLASLAPPEIITATDEGAHPDPREVDKAFAEMEKTKGADRRSRSDDLTEVVALSRRMMPYYSFNIQRFDLTTV